MSGHSKWSTIKYKKGIADAKRGKIFSKIGREIVVAVKVSGEIPSNNPRLKSAIIAAKAVNMPNDTVNRAIKKGCGNTSDDYTALSYEGYAIEGVAIVVDCLSDNRNRTASEVRSIFNKNNGKLGVSGTVSWMFHRKSQFIIEGEKADEELLMEIVLDAGAEEINIDDNIAEIIGADDAFNSIQKALEAAGIEPSTSHLTKIPETNINITDVSKAKQILRLIEALENDDDVQNVFANFNIDQSILEEAFGN